MLSRLPVRSMPLLQKWGHWRLRVSSGNWRWTNANYTYPAAARTDTMGRKKGNGLVRDASALKFQSGEIGTRVCSRETYPPLDLPPPTYDLPRPRRPYARHAQPPPSFGWKIVGVIQGAIPCRRRMRQVCSQVWVHSNVIRPWSSFRPPPDDSRGPPWNSQRPDDPRGVHHRSNVSTRQDPFHRTFVGVTWWKSGEN